jgi:hypothetical protein
MWNYVRGLIGVLFFVVGLAGESQAGIIIEVKQAGPDVMMSTNGGILKVSGLTYQSGGVASGGITPSSLMVGGGNMMTFQGDFTSYDFVTSGTSFNFATTNVLGPVGFVNQAQPGQDKVYVPMNSVSSGGDATIPTFSMSVFSNATLSSLELIPGSYTVAWGSGPDQDSITVNVVGAAAVPEPGTAAIGLILGGAAMFRRFRKRRA